MFLVQHKYGNTENRFWLLYRIGRVSPHSLLLGCLGVYLYMGVSVYGVQCGHHGSFATLELCYHPGYYVMYG